MSTIAETVLKGTYSKGATAAKRTIAAKADGLDLPTAHVPNTISPAADGYTDRNRPVDQEGLAWLTR
jgi:hypothetical protein